MNRSRRRRRPEADADYQRRTHALRQWVALQMADDVAARYAAYIIRLHADLMWWISDAEVGHVLSTYALGSSVSQSSEPDDRILALVVERIETGGDPEHLEPLRQKLTHNLGDFASWYTKVAGSVDLDDWEPLAVRLGDFIGDHVAAGALATCLLCHRCLVLTGDTYHRKHARDRWWRAPGWHIRRRDGQPEKGRVTGAGRPRVESVGPDEVRQIEGAPGQSDSQRRIG